jgi:hypothetical protein
MSTLTVQNLRGVTPSNLIRVPTGHSLYAPGHIVQVQSINKLDTFQTNSTTYVGVTGLSVAITPKYTTSNILIISCVNGNSQNRGGTLRLYRDGSPILLPTAASNRGTTNIGALWTGDGSGDTGMMFSVSTQLLDSPASTSTLTYQIYARSIDGSNYGTRINWTGDDTDGTDYVRAVSTLTLMEIAA